MHSVARENLQSYLHSYKSSSKEVSEDSGDHDVFWMFQPGIQIIHNSNKDDQQRKSIEHFAALKSLRHAKVGVPE